MFNKNISNRSLYEHKNINFVGLHHRVLEMSIDDCGIVDLKRLNTIGRVKSIRCLRKG